MRGLAATCQHRDRTSVNESIRLRCHPYATHASHSFRLTLPWRAWQRKLVHSTNDRYQSAVTVQLGQPVLDAHSSNLKPEEKDTKMIPKLNGKKWTAVAF